MGHIEEVCGDEFELPKQPPRAAGRPLLKVGIQLLRQCWWCGGGRCEWQV
jgi:hypothetical protein